MSAESIRKIIHVDMDAFYASVEQRDHPELRGRPVAVGGSPDKRGVVAAASYEARKFGVRSATPSSRALRLCPGLQFVRPRFDVYKEVSAQIRAIFRDYTELVEPLSLDEAYLDVSQAQQCRGSATLIAEEIRARILSATELTASAGVSYNKFLAKTASDINKPNGLTVVLPSAAQQLLDELPIGRFFGVGKATERRMQKLGVRCGADLRALPEAELIDHFGKAGRWYYQIVRGHDPRPVRPNRERKSWGSETTFAEDLSAIDEITTVLERLANQLGNGMAERKMLAQTLTLKVRYADFRQITRSQTVDEISCSDDLLALLPSLIGRTEIGARPVRLLGLTLSNFIPVGAGQMSLL